MIGYGPEGKRGRGYRGRLWARAMVLEDGWGERLALVQLDLAMPSLLVHRRVAALTVDTARAGIGADRLLLAATHTHSAPGHFHGMAGFDMFGAAEPGYDSLLTVFFVERIARAVNDAAGDLRPARAAWGTEPVWGHTRIRSIRAHDLNAPPWKSPYAPPPGLTHEQQGVDPAWTMLRVEAWDEGTRRWAPRGAFSVFAIHGTAVPAANDLFDPDVPGIVSRRLEAHVDSLNGERPDGYRRRAVHVFANGAQGDVSPDVPRETRCPAPTLASTRRPTGPRTPPQPQGWRDAPDPVLEACLTLAQRWTDSLGRALAAVAARQFDALGAAILADTAGARGLRISRAFATAVLREREGETPLCAKAVAGTGLESGAEDGYTRLRGWKPLGVFGPGLGIVPGTPLPRGDDCQDPKRPFLGPLQPIVIGADGLPHVAQLSVVRIGDRVLGAVPAEPTTTVGGRIRGAIAAGAGVDPRSVVLMGLVNGYIQYVTTAEEYAVQYYEGAATEYGPGTAAFLQGELGRLAATVPAGRPSPPAEVHPLPAHTPRPRRLTERPSGPAAVERRFVELRWEGDSVLVARWNDVRPGRFVPAEGPVLAIYRQAGSDKTLVTWDDDNELEVRALSRRPRGQIWEARWMPCRLAAGVYRVRLLARPGMGEVEQAVPGTVPERRCTVPPRRD
jgi:neutral ceramidase